MKLGFNDYREKVQGCWTGKNIGGVLGAPYEGVRQKIDIDFYTQDLTMGPPANDDLDLQIVWLAAVEKYGRNVSASILGEYWLSYIIPNWVEYGVGKANLRAGFVPPMAGVIDNTYKDSCGSFIRSELWACLAPGNPEIAARYAYEDAIVDHADEGVYGEVFFAAMESAAFVESDRDQLIDIGLSYIPKDSAVTKAVKQAIASYNEGKTFFETRDIVHDAVPGTFGIQLNKLSEIAPEERHLKTGAPGFDAPENIAYAIMGWLYGEGDFGKALSLAVSCGEDTDCSGASLGALLGIIYGSKSIPTKWTEPLNDKIATICIDKSSKGVWVPETVTELTNRLLNDMPAFMGPDKCDLLDMDGYTVDCLEGEDLYLPSDEEYLPRINGMGKPKGTTVAELLTMGPYVAKYENVAFQVLVDYEGNIGFTTAVPRRFKVKVMDRGLLNQQQWVKLNLYLPDGVSTQTGKSRELPLNNLYQASAETEFVLNVEEFSGERLDLILDISLVGRHTSMPIKVSFVRQG